jgi:hypothetical protein
MKSTISLLSLFAGASLSQAATIANWNEFNPNAAVVPITGAATDSPTFGDGTTTNSAQQAWIGGQFGTTGSPASATLAIGETLTVSGLVVLTGGTNNSNQVRFGVFDDGGQFSAGDGSNWTGGWLHSIGTTTSSDLFRGRTDGPFISTGGDALDLNSVITRTGTFDGDSTAPFSFSMAITRDSATTIDVTSLITGGDGGLSEQYVESDITTGVFTYSAVGLLFGGSSGIEQAQFSGVQYNVIPEPSGSVLGILGLAALASRRRRR